MRESRHARKRSFSWVAFAVLAIFAFFALLGAGLLFSFLSGTGSDLPAHSATDRLKDGLLLSPALLPSCAIVALVAGHVTLSKILAGVGVPAALLLALGAVAAQIDTEHTTFQGSAAVYGFGLAFLFGLITLFLPFRADRQRTSMPAGKVSRT
jgi:hypothetical protein